ncbi:MAG: TetR/AcrR family transcriptional regulator [Roseitalea sp.]|nr:TetR/AcrR family transcriptional regulator [Roseitalea sp.]MBO6720908.1 TetR/AcrR family transcriptional regulator [Roseitalea sp.]MBO6743213.1 TetR/AcrR family transcriptional regulator [Roseitalea sp.]
MPDDKRSTILRAAFEVFVTYGFRKTSMDDIARMAGMSRPTLYQAFRNKTEIFRGLAEEMMKETAAKAQAALARPGSFHERLESAINDSILDMHRFIERTPHGVELMGVNDEIAADIEERWCEVMVDVVAHGIKAAADDGELDLSRTASTPESAARIFMQAMEGLKGDAMRGKPIEHHVEALVLFVSGALAADRP